MSIAEVQGMEGEAVTMQEIFKFEQLGVDSTGKARGRFVATGLRPNFIDRLKAAGANLDMSLFRTPGFVHGCEHLRSRMIAAPHMLVLEVDFKSLEQLGLSRPARVRLGHAGLRDLQPHSRFTQDRIQKGQPALTEKNGPEAESDRDRARKSRSSTLAEGDRYGFRAAALAYGHHARDPAAPGPGQSTVVGDHRADQRDRNRLGRLHRLLLLPTRTVDRPFDLGARSCCSPFSAIVFLSSGCGWYKFLNQLPTSSS